MMGFFRNREATSLTIALLAGTALFSAIGFFMDLGTGILTLVACLFISIIALWVTAKRYKKIAALSNRLNRILHGAETLLLEDNAEGELAILESEIYKMTLRLREHSYALQKEKIYLTDSIADISHQLRTPLTTINLLMFRLQRRELPEGDRMEMVREINQHLARIDWLVSSLLKISKIDAGTAAFKKERVSVSDLVAKAVDPFLVPMEIRDQTFDFISQGEEMFIGDMNWTVEAVGNVIKNCMEHTPEGGRITVAANETPLYTEVIVRDTGPGFEPEDLPRLFERFYRGKQASETGVGIGLALARMIILEQNGSIKAENHRHGGAIFTIRFYKLRP
jgi:signal transduction histidine kinase